MYIYKAVNLRDGSRPVRYFPTKELRRDYIRAEARRGVTEISLSVIYVDRGKLAVVDLLNNEIGSVSI
jgi:hypothetical protein